MYRHVCDYCERNEQTDIQHLYMYPGVFDLFVCNTDDIVCAEGKLNGWPFRVGFFSFHNWPYRGGNKTFVQTTHNWTYLVFFFFLIEITRTRTQRSHWILHENHSHCSRTFPPHNYHNCITMNNLNTLQSKNEKNRFENVGNVFRV